MLPEFVKAIRRSRLPDPVRERLGVVGPVTEPGRLIPQGDASHVEQGGVRVAEGVPSHAWAVQIPHRVNQCLACAAVVPFDGQVEFFEDGERTIAQRNRPYSLTLMLVVDGGRDVERQYHAIFDPYRRHGEWFALPVGWENDPRVVQVAA